jgi:predicted benzoate:H+ symporter BenE
MKEPERIKAAKWRLSAAVNGSFFMLTPAIGAYVVTGVLIYLLGITGAFKKGMAILPMPVMMGMVRECCFHLE